MEDRMDEAYSAACLACGRVLGHVYRRMYYAESPSARLERAARQFRCSRCHGSVLFEPDPAWQPPRDWIAELRRAEASSGQRKRPYRRRAG
jgi:hypothetical protein